MAEVLLFHHAQGLTPGLVSFADHLRRAGHIVHTPDLFEGRTFDTLEKGMSFVAERGFGELIERGVRAAEGLSTELVYAGFSLGEVVHRSWLKPRPGACGALLFYSCVPVSEFGSAWPKGCRCKCMVWTLIRSLSVRVTSMPLGRLLNRSRRGSNCSCTQAISITLPTAHYHHTMRKRRHSSCNGCLTFSLLGRKLIPNLGSAEGG